MRRDEYLRAVRQNSSADNHSGQARSARSPVLLVSAVGAVLATAVCGASLGGAFSRNAVASVNSPSVAIEEPASHSAPIALRTFPSEPEVVRVASPIPVLSMPEERTEIAAAPPLVDEAPRRIIPGVTNGAPNPFEGLWYAKFEKDCVLPPDDEIDRIPLRFTENGIKFYETYCRIALTTQRGSHYSVLGECESEGVKFSATTDVTMLDNDRIEVQAYEAAGISKQTYMRCPVRAKPKPQKSTPVAIPAPRPSYTGLKRTSVDICYGRFNRDTCPDANPQCRDPVRAGEVVGFMAWSIENGQKIYHQYRIAGYPASNITLEPNCKLPRYNIEGEISRRQSNLKIIDQVLSNRR